MSKDHTAHEPEKNSEPNPFTLTTPQGGDTPSIWLITSPHSGHYYPRDFIVKSKLDSQQLRLSEDMHIDALLERCSQSRGKLTYGNIPARLC